MNRLSSTSQQRLHPGRLTWNLRIRPWKRKNIFQTIIFRFYDSLRGCSFQTEKPMSYLRISLKASRWWIGFKDTNYVMATLPAEWLSLLPFFVGGWKAAKKQPWSLYKSPWKFGDSYWKPSFSGSMLNFRGVGDWMFANEEAQERRTFLNFNKSTQAVVMCWATWTVHLNACFRFLGNPYKINQNICFDIFFCVFQIEHLVFSVGFFQMGFSNKPSQIHGVTNHGGDFHHIFLLFVSKSFVFWVACL